ncbi:hypothetical protein [Bacillus sp. B-jedd]|uniref:hypothetical protein n=1 Tax=Bacillus sp. B-jedd TaxID=1476857 RepID=UPI000A69198B|nr:hypothetical protein [Bacillus sp. B-jedd]
MKLIGTEGTDSGGMQRHVETPQASTTPRRLQKDCSCATDYSGKRTFSSSQSCTKQIQVDASPRGKHVPGVEINIKKR